ncbi:hypothetical protein D3C72_1480740 [compost metagenome]
MYQTSYLSVMKMTLLTGQKDGMELLQTSIQKEEQTVLEIEASKQITTQTTETHLQDQTLLSRMQHLSDLLLESQTG